MRNSTVAGIALTTLCATAICSRVSGALASEGVGLSLDDLRQQYHWPSGTEAVGGESNLPKTQECAVAQAAYAFGLHLLPELSPNRDLFDALELENCGNTPPPQTKPRTPPSFPLPANAIYVDPTTGSDSGTGSVTDPLATLAVAVAKAGGRDRTARCVVLRSGVHYLTSTIEIGAALSGLTIQNYPEEAAWISGGMAITPEWRKAEGFPTELNVWAAHLPAVARVRGLNRLTGYVDPTHARMTRARFPNRDPTAGTQEKGLLGSSGVTWIKPRGWGVNHSHFNLSSTVWLDSPSSDGAAGGGGTHFTYGVGGWSCGRYTPAGGFWCSNQSSGGGSGWELMVPGAPLFPIGVEVQDAVWAQSVAAASRPPNPSTWQNKSTAIIETWTNGWSTTFWEVTDITDDGQGNSTFVFGGKGGQQSGRGFHIDPPATPPPDLPMEKGAWKVENAIELLDAPEEYFFNEVTRTLYLAHNGTGPPPTTGWIVPHLKELLRIVGTKTEPVTHIDLLGVGFRDSEYTYLDDWGIPSGGDWALHRGGAVFLEGVEFATVDRANFMLLDGNALFLSGYTRNVTIEDSFFSFIGDNAMAAWGYTEDVAGRKGTPLPPGTGIDGTSGEQPRFTEVLRNVVREIGMNERQSSAWSEAKACQNHVHGNLFYNMPRAAINKNDGFGGATLIENNLLFNTCRESGDHGPFNSWDRQPFLTDVATGEPSLIPAYTEIRQNFFWSNYGAGFGVDNDDTSSYYLIHHNFFYLGGGVKCDYDGHEKRFYENVMLGTTAGCWHTCAYKKGFPDYCYNNTLVQASRAPHPGQQFDVSPFAIIWFCDAKNVSHILPDYNNEVQMGDYIHGNRVYNDKGHATVTCGYSGPENATTVPLDAFTSVGLMKGTTVGVTPDDATVIRWARALLGW